MPDVSGDSSPASDDCARICRSFRSIFYCTAMMTEIYPRTGDLQTVYLNAVVRDPSIEVGDYTVYNDFRNDPRDFARNNVLYHYPIHRERLVVGKFCSIACGAKFLFNCATTRCGRCRPIRFRSFTSSGGWTGPMSHRLGMTRAIS